MYPLWLLHQCLVGFFLSRFTCLKEWPRMWPAWDFTRMDDSCIPAEKIAWPGYGIWGECFVSLPLFAFCQPSCRSPGVTPSSARGCFRSMPLSTVCAFIQTRPPSLLGIRVGPYMSGTLPPTTTNNWLVGLQSYLGVAAVLLPAYFLYWSMLIFCCKQTMVCFLWKHAKPYLAFLVVYAWAVCVQIVVAWLWT